MTSLVPDPAATPPQTVRVANVANGLTLLRLLLVPVFAVLLLHADGADTGWRVAAWAVFAVASITDRMDGQLARSRGLVTEFGKLADPIADKALIGTALVGLSSLGLLWWWVTAVILVREIGVTLLRFWVIRHGVIPASRGGKLKTLLQGVAIGLYVLPLSDGAALVAACVMAAALLLTLATGADYVARAMSLRRAGVRQATAAVRAAPAAPAAGPAAPATPAAQAGAPARSPAPARTAASARATGQAAAPATPAGQAPGPAGAPAGPGAAAKPAAPATPAAQAAGPARPGAPAKPAVPAAPPEAAEAAEP